jgi:hypothetical protein
MRDPVVRFQRLALPVDCEDPTRFPEIARAIAFAKARREPLNPVTPEE